jgi:hypothetical protein
MCLASGALHACWLEDDSSNDVAASPAPAPASYTVGGGVTGLNASGLVIANGTDTVAVAATDTGFTLPTAVAQSGSYAVTVKTQPNGEQCSVSNGAGTVNGANVTNVMVTCAALAHTLGGSISGLPSAGLILSNGSDTVAPAAGALSFTFATPVAEGGAYAVAVKTQPSGATCSVGSGSGTMGTGNVNSVQVTCSAVAYHLSGTISGLSASGLILANGTDTVSPPANATSFAFPTAVAFGGSYSVTVQQQPPGLTCTAAGSYPATMGAGDVTTLAVSCQANSALTLLAGQQQCPTPPNVDGVGAAASIPGVFSLVTDSAGNIYAAGNQYGLSGDTVVTKITASGTVSTLAGQDGVTGYVDGPGTSALFSTPYGVGVNASGTVYVVDNYLVRSISPTGVVATVAGSAGVGYQDGSGTVAQFSTGLGGTAVDTQGNVFVVDGGNHRIRKITPAGVVSTFAGGGGSTSANASGFQDGIGTQALFALPSHLTIDAAGNLFVADQYGSAIRKIAPDGTVSTLAGGAFATRGFANGTGSAAQFDAIGALAAGPSGSLYVLDQDNYSITGGGIGFRAVRQVSAAGVVTTPLQWNVAPAPGVTVLSTFLQGMTTDRNGALVLGIGCSLQKFGP